MAKMEKHGNLNSHFEFNQIIYESLLRALIMSTKEAVSVERFFLHGSSPDERFQGEQQNISRFPLSDKKSQRVAFLINTVYSFSIKSRFDD